MTAPAVPAVGLPKTAVIVVHGIGEQRPLDTLFGFVGDSSGNRGILMPGDPPSCVNPDVVSNATYLRRITFEAKLLATNPGTAAISSAARSDPAKDRVVDFYEYYWAYRFRDTTWRHIGNWAKDLLHTHRSDVTSEALLGTRSRGMRTLLWVAFCALWLAILALAAGVSATPTRASLVERLAVLDLPWSGLPVAIVIIIVLLGLLVVAVNPLGLIAIAKVAVSMIGLVLLVTAAGSMNWSAFDARWQRIGALAGAVVLVATVLLRRRMKMCAASAAPSRWCGRVPLGGLLTLVTVFAAALVTASVWTALEPTGALLIAVVPGVVTVLALLTSRAILGVVGDAARYLSNSPDNVQQREKIRTGLVDILDRLHRQRDPETGLMAYDRIVVVGHSLGSVIAYDALQVYWATVAPNIVMPAQRESSSNSDRAQLAVLKGLEDLATVGGNGGDGGMAVGSGLQELNVMSPAESDAPSAWESAPAWRDAQRRLQLLLRYPDVDPGSSDERPRWIVTDLVTAGSPLAHAEMLLARNKDDLAFRKKRHLVSTDPPGHQLIDGNGSSPTFRHVVTSLQSPTGDTTRLLSVAMFSAVTWTNIYFSYDLVGGKLAGIFGDGIDDVELLDGKPYLLRFLSQYPHSSYWPGPGTRPKSGESRTKLRELLLEQLPILQVAGTDDQIRAFAQTEYASVGNNTVAPLDDALPLCELRLLVRKTVTETGSRPGLVEVPVKWIWPGPSPLLGGMRAEAVATAATGAGLKVCLSTLADGVLDFSPMVHWTVK